MQYNIALNKKKSQIFVMTFKNNDHSPSIFFRKFVTSSSLLINFIGIVVLKKNCAITHMIRNNIKEIKLLYKIKNITFSLFFLLPRRLNVLFHTIRYNLRRSVHEPFLGYRVCFLFARVYLQHSYFRI